jgi:hypothetical protein
MLVTTSPVKTWFRYSVVNVFASCMNFSPRNEMFEAQNNEKMLPTSLSSLPCSSSPLELQKNWSFSSLKFSKIPVLSRHDILGELK